MRRRDFIKVIVGLATARPLSAYAQPSNRMRRMGMLLGLPEGDPEAQRWLKSFLQAFQELGWKRGTNVQIDIRWSNNVEQMRAYAKDLVGSRPDLIQVATTPATAAILRETKTIPVVFTVVSDPIGSGFIQSLRRPGGNATGFINIEASLGGKWLELLKQLAPRVSRISLLFNPATAPQAPYYRKPLESAAATLGVAVTAAPVNNVDEIKSAIAGLGDDGSAGLIVLPDLFVSSHRELIASQAAAQRLPAVYPFRFFVKAGGLLSYGVDLADLQRRAATYCDKILKGEKAADLPVQLPTKFELAINLKTAKMIGIAIPLPLLATADEVIE